MNKYLPSGLLFAYVLKCGVVPPSIHDALIVASLAAYQGLSLYLDSHNAPALRKELQASREELAKDLEMSKQYFAAQVQSLKDQLSSMNLGSIKKSESLKFKF